MITRELEKTDPATEEALWWARKYPALMMVIGETVIITVEGLILLYEFLDADGGHGQPLELAASIWAEADTRYRAWAVQRVEEAIAALAGEGRPMSLDGGWCGADAHAARREQPWTPR